MKKNRITYWLLTAAVILTAAVFTVMLLRRDTLTLRDENSGKVYARYALEEGESFSVTFRHSVNKSNVTEIYERRGRDIYLTGCVYYDFGAGVAEVLDEGWTLTMGDEGEMILSDIDMKMDHMVYIVGTIYDHVMTWRGEEIVLNELCGKNSQVRFCIG